MEEESGRNTPERSFLFLLALDGSQSRGNNSNFVEPGKNLSTGKILELLSCLDKEASICNLGKELLAIFGPDVKTWETRFAVDSKEVEITFGMFWLVKFQNL